MKRLIIIILMMLLIPISYVGAEDKETVDSAKDKTLMYFKGYLPVAVKHNMADCLDCIEEQKRIIDVGRMGAGVEITNSLNKSKSKQNNTLPFSFIIMPNIEESQPSWLIQFTYSY